MKHLLVVCLCLLSFGATGQQATYHQKGYTLYFTNADQVSKELQQRMVNTFFKVYPQLATQYNTKTAKTVYIIIDSTYKGVAATDNAHVRISPEWMQKHPEDIDVVTHEVMHIVQDYGESTGPGWLTEGIADYARNKFGVNNAAAGWSLPAYKQGQNYTDAYRVTARFLLWLETHVKHGIVQQMDKQMRAHTYKDASWAKQTGRSLDELWKQYTENPAI